MSDEINTSLTNFLKLGVLSAVSWLIFYLIDNSEKLNRLFFTNQVGESSKKFEGFLMILIIKYSLFMTGLVTSAFFI